MGGSSASIPARSAAATRSMTPGITCRYSPASPAPCATAHPSRTGCCRRQWSACGASSPADDGNRQMVDILTAVLTDGLLAVEAACTEAIAHGVHSADVVLNILARQRDPAPPTTILTPAALTLRHAPIADCARYDNLTRTLSCHDPNSSTSWASSSSTA